MAIAAASVEVIDLCDSDEDEVDFIPPPAASSNANRRLLLRKQEGKNSNVSGEGMGLSWSQTETSRKRTREEDDNVAIKLSKTSETIVIDDGSMSTGHVTPSNVAQVGPTKISKTSAIPVTIDSDGQEDNGIITEGIMELMDELNSVSMNPARLCTRSCNVRHSGSPRQQSTVRHIQQKDSWSCGFRNLQMVLTALLPELQSNHPYFQMVPRRTQCISIPNIGQIQNSLEQAWNEGYDPRGACHYNYKIRGKKPKIGAIEVSSVLAYWGLDATVIQFVTCQESRVMLTKFVEAYFSKALGQEGCSCCKGRGIKSDRIAEQLLQFATASLKINESCDCPLLPLYLQWEGHSITVVGTNDKGCWLVLDPMKDGRKLQDKMQRDKSTDPALFSPCKIRSSDTQIVLTTYGALSYQEKKLQRENLRILTAATEHVMRAVAASENKR